jgi:3',5'-cyclic-AMP phosphodiesterase
MAQKMMANRTSEQNEFARNHDTVDHDGIDRRGFLKCMAWAGTGALCVIQGGVLKSYSLSNPFDMKRRARGELSFIQISDSHMGFNKPANPDVVATLKAAVDKINGLPVVPEFMLHTGDISHLSKAEEFDNVDQILKSARPRNVFFVPGEHDVLEDDGRPYRERYAKNARGHGWYSFDVKGVHLVGLVNVMSLKAGGLARSSWNGWKKTSNIFRGARPWLCSPIFLFGRYTGNGVGGLQTAPRPCRT